MGVGRGFDEKVIMKIYVEPDAPKTRRFLQYIYGELLDRAPLHQLEVVQIRVAENITPFPKITEVADKGVVGSDFKYEMEQKALRNLRRLEALEEYMWKTLCYVAGNLPAKLEDAKKLDVMISLAVVNPAGVYREAEKLGLKIPATASVEARDMTAAPTFTENPPQIEWMGTIISIASDSNPLCFCRVAFSTKVGEIFSWAEVAKAIDPLAYEHNDVKSRSVYDAARKINKSVAEATGKPLFKTARLSFYRLA